MSCTQGALESLPYTCDICGVVLRSEAGWNDHVRSRLREDKLRAPADSQEPSSSPEPVSNAAEGFLLVSVTGSRFVSRLTAMKKGGPYLGSIAFVFVRPFLSLISSIQL